MLGVEERHQREVESVQKSLVVLNLLSAMCESLGPECFKNPQHILDFVQVSCRWT